ncbi:MULTISPECIES: hypothetical protein [Rhodospirillales]|uniref:hypothetical protein n=1 Tax=Rhodospirillales TaxID=204441 RepID=UPI001268503B|nr:MULTISPECIES: hypothetical protein [Rhodospirillales]CAA7626623.1 hypothetical protein MTBSS4_640001 [Magnetospirillum sp. SS-4]
MKSSRFNVYYENDPSNRKCLCGAINTVWMQGLAARAYPYSIGDIDKIAKAISREVSCESVDEDDGTKWVTVELKDEDEDVVLARFEGDGTNVDWVCWLTDHVPTPKIEARYDYYSWDGECAIGPVYCVIGGDLFIVNGGESGRGTLYDEGDNFGINEVTRVYVEQVWSDAHDMERVLTGKHTFELSVSKWEDDDYDEVDSGHQLSYTADEVRKMTKPDFKNEVLNVVSSWFER